MRRKKLKRVCIKKRFLNSNKVYFGVHSHLQIDIFAKSLDNFPFKPFFIITGGRGRRFSERQEHNNHLSTIILLNQQFNTNSTFSGLITFGEPVYNCSLFKIISKLYLLKYYQIVLYFIANKSLHILVNRLIFVIFSIKIIKYG